MARAHRIGQKSHVNVYRFVAKDTVEEEVLEPEEVETTVTVMRNPRKRPPKRWFGGW